MVPMHESAGSLDFRSLRSRLADGGGRLHSFYEGLRAKLEDYPDSAVWIARVPWKQVQARLKELESKWSQDPDGFLRLPLYGIPFAVKDNLDVEGMETTAACPAFAYRPQATATVVARLLDAGAVLIGKTNMDQFATGLVGTRSPYGTVRNPFHSAYVPGGSSSGSAVAVSAGLVSFALGTDTAGSGRVPAGFNNVVGLKPSKGALSAYGVFPACRSLDCVSVFALTGEDAFEIFSRAAGTDPLDPFTREIPAERKPAALGFARPPARFQFGVPDASALETADDETRALFGAAIARLEGLGGTRVEIPFAPFAGAARLLYQGPWLAERQAAFGGFVDSHPGDVLPVIRQILSPAKSLTAEAGFRAYYKLRELKVRAQGLLRGLDALVVPTAPIHPTRDEVEADPIGVNSRLGAYTNFVNLLDLCALAIPSGMRANGLPFGVTLIAPAFQDGVLASLGAAFHAATGLGLGSSAHPVPTPSPSPAIDPAGPEGARSARLAVAGLHLSGQPLNRQLLELDARLHATVRTAPCYRMHLIERPGRKFPGLVRAAEGGAIELEVWEMTRAALGAFMEKVLEPLCIGTIELENGGKVQGFLCEAWAAADARDITSTGGWRTYLAQA